MTLSVLKSNGRIGLQPRVRRPGPGIADIAAMTDGFTTARSLGLGLGGAKRLVNEFEITSRPADGTVRVHHAMETTLSVSDPSHAGEARRAIAAARPYPRAVRRTGRAVGAGRFRAVHQHPEVRPLGQPDPRRAPSAGIVARPGRGGARQGPRHRQLRRRLGRRLFDRRQPGPGSGHRAARFGRVRRLQRQRAGHGHLREDAGPEAVGRGHRPRSARARCRCAASASAATAGRPVRLAIGWP